MTLCDRGEAWVLQIAEAAMGKRFRRSSGISEQKFTRVSLLPQIFCRYLSPRTPKKHTKPSADISHLATQRSTLHADWYQGFASAMPFMPTHKTASAAAPAQSLKRAGVSNGCGTPERRTLIRIVFKLHHYRRVPQLEVRDFKIVQDYLKGTAGRGDATAEWLEQLR